MWKFEAHFNMSRLKRVNNCLPVALLTALLLLAFSYGVGTTGNLYWPADSDLERDSAQAMTIYDGDLLGDPQYVGEMLWYNPLTPSLVALIARVSNQPLPLIYTRAGAYFNLFVPILFYVLVAVLLDQWKALVATAAFLFVQIAPPTSSQFYATYTAWLFAAELAQAWLYGTLIVFVIAIRTQRRRWFVLTGILLGLAFLAHSGPALMLGISIAGYTAMIVIRNQTQRRAALINFGVIIGLALIVSAPLTYSLVVRYRLDVFNLIPGDSIHPPVALDNLVTYWRASTIEQPLFLVVIVGFIAIFRRARRPGSRLIIALWLLGAIGVLAYSYLRQYLKRQGIEIPGFVPSYHFLVYLRAVESLLFGAGVVALCGMAASLIVRMFKVRSEATTTRLRVEHGLVMVVLIGLFIAVWPAYLERRDFNDLPRGSVLYEQNADFVNTYNWLRANARPNDVVLASDRLATYVIGPAGRKIVAGDSFYANPYVDWKTRADDRDAMFGQLMAGDCATFLPIAAKYPVAYVAAGGNLAKDIDATAPTCVEKVLAGSSVQVYRVVR
jgi:hypothetical protein